MFPPPFDYRRADSVESAVDLLAAHEDAAVLAGGHGLVPDMKAGVEHPGTLVDVSGVDALAGVDVDDGTVRVGALATHATLAASEPLADAAPALAEAAANVGDRQIRNRGTIGGNLAEADPAADPPAAVVAAGAAVRVRGPDGSRSIPAGEFFEGDAGTALADDELVTGVALPSHAGGAYAKRTDPATGYATVGVAAVVAVEDGAVRDPRVAATGAADRPVRLSAVEERLAGAAVDGDVAERAAERAGEALDPDRLRSDVHATGEFRGRLLGPYAERAVARALDRAEGGGAG